MVSLNHLIAVAVIAGFGLLAPGVSLAQSNGEMTAEEMTEAFKKQKTRGLVIVPSGQQPATDSTAETASVATAATTDEATTYAEVDPQDQVNIWNLPVPVNASVNKELLIELI